MRRISEIVREVFQEVDAAIAIQTTQTYSLEPPKAWWGSNRDENGNLLLINKENNAVIP